jgi:hypothetical protein
MLGMRANPQPQGLRVVLHRAQFIKGAGMCMAPVSQPRGAIFRMADKHVST